MKIRNRLVAYFPEQWAAYCARERWEEIKNQPLPTDFVPVDAEPMPAPVLPRWFTFEELQAQAAAEVAEIIARSKRREARRKKKSPTK